MKQFTYKFTLAVMIALSISSFYGYALEKDPTDHPPLGPIHNLLVDLEYHVCSFLESSSDLSGLAQINKHWNQVLTEVYNRANSTFVMGTVGCGTSTLALLLGGKQLDVVVPSADPLGCCLFQHENDDSKGITIAHGNAIGTPKHTCIYYGQANRKIWDCSPFESRFFKAEEDFSQAQQLQGRLKGPLRVIIAIQEPNVERNIERYEERGVVLFEAHMKVLSRVAEMFSDLEQLKEVVTLVITKYSGKHTPTEIVKWCLKAQEQNPRSFAIYLSDLLTYLLANPKKIIAFPRPTQSGPYVINDELRSLMNDNTFIMNPTINAPTLWGFQHENWCETKLSRFMAHGLRNVEKE